MEGTPGQRTNSKKKPRGNKYLLEEKFSDYIIQKVSDPLDRDSRIYMKIFLKKLLQDFKKIFHITLTANIITQTIALM